MIQPDFIMIRIKLKKQISPENKMLKYQEFAP